MTFWIISGAMALLVGGLLARAAWRGADTPLPAQADYDLKVYRDQLAEVERDVARGVVPEADAARIRTEISRRILAADAACDKVASGGGRPAPWVLALGVLVLGGSALGLYWKLGQPGYGDLALADRIAFAEDMRRNRPDQASAVASLPASPTTEGLSADYLKLIQQLRATVKERPDDVQGQVLLAQNEARIGNFAAAADAQANVLRLKGAERSAKDIADYAELLVLAAGGYVSPEAETALREVLNRDEDNGRARYYLGLMMVQTGRPDVGFRLWDALLRRGPEDAAWIEPIRAQIPQVAALAGVDYELPQVGTGAPARGPSAEDIEAATEMTADDRMEMIGGMVAGLSDRLANEGGPPQDWARLITSLGVLGDTDQARAVYENALEVFTGNNAALDMIRAAGERAGVAG
ncbi:c-type cytochrome biogenesis protein CcmI [Sulfitobacter delicatus]|uniref:Cytochrome c-type biogenesis protein CcmH n=1 Tax=Sulfitobacter delicatus TaxID=218672 RepID=A0A1G7NZC0_9RHOB|nr:c-type cytochrome biogenesis protein CcmI [Sulfitobacter delicatus]SDF79207.1 cytochrome c-type biogenesis protein CcmH [Sulfitobacter delicatus]